MVAIPKAMIAQTFDGDDDDHHHHHDYDEDEKEEKEEDGGRGEYDDVGDEVMDNANEVHLNSDNNNFHRRQQHHGHRAGGGGGGGVGGRSVEVVASASRTSELTLAFEGEVYVFPAITPQKVQAVLLLLGGRDVPTAVPNADVIFAPNNKGMEDTSKRSNLSRKIASLVRFREKRNERFFDKKIRYSIRKEVAQRMHSKNGQFVSVKEGSASSNWDSARSSLQGDNKSYPEIVIRGCNHCSVSENCTHAMRRGLAGPRTLCNACGLMWANNGTLQDRSKGRRSSSLHAVKPDTPSDVKPSVFEGENSSGNQDEHGTSLKAIKEGTDNHPANPDEKHVCGSGEDLKTDMPVGIATLSGDLDE